MTADLLPTHRFERSQNRQNSLDGVATLANGAKWRLPLCDCVDKCCRLALKQRIAIKCEGFLLPRTVDLGDPRPFRAVALEAGLATRADHGDRQFICRLVLVKNVTRCDVAVACEHVRGVFDRDPFQLQVRGICDDACGRSDDPFHGVDQMCERVLTCSAARRAVGVVNMAIRWSVRRKVLAGDNNDFKRPTKLAGSDRIAHYGDRRVSPVRIGNAGDYAMGGGCGDQFFNPADLQAERLFDQRVDSAFDERSRLRYMKLGRSSHDGEIERRGEVRKELTISSPVSGYVMQKDVVAGQKIMAGETIYRIADLREVWVEGEVFEQDLAAVRVGQTVHADLPAMPGEHRMGKISFVYPTISPETRTARVRVVLANGDLRLKPGMYATLVIVGTERGRVLTVPRGAVLSTGERNVVFVRDSANVLTPREVAIGAANDERIEVLRGLREGETVVSSATFLVDAESNLAKALGGMGSMPGMDMQTPPAPLPMQETRAGTSASPAAKRPASPAATKDSTDHSGHGGHPEP